MAETETLALFAGNANPALAHDIARQLTTPLGRAYVGRFSDGEVNIELMENVRESSAARVQESRRTIGQPAVRPRSAVRPISNSAAGSVPLREDM